VNWPLITEDEQERQMRRLAATIKFGTDLRGDLRDQALRQYFDAHPEKDLLAFLAWKRPSLLLSGKAASGPVRQAATRIAVVKASE
jgi:hypothetical protein